MPPRPAGLPPAYSVSGLPPASASQSPRSQSPLAMTIPRSNSFYSVDSGNVGAGSSSAGPGSSNARGGGGGGPTSVVQSVGGRVAGWVGEHRADVSALCVAGIAAAQLA